jgi:hypothetical protein
MGFGEKSREFPSKINVYLCLDWLLEPLRVKEDNGTDMQAYPVRCH